MSTDFDPFQQWLSIGKHQRPLHFYLVLGLEPFESDTARIAEAADRAMNLVADHAAGPQADAAKKLLGQIAQIRTCLLDPKQRASYDVKLRALLAGGAPRDSKSSLPSATPSTGMTVPPSPPPVPQRPTVPQRPAVPQVPFETSGTALSSPANLPRRMPWIKWAVPAVLVAVVASVAAIYFVTGKPDDVAPTETAQATDPTPDPAATVAPVEPQPTEEPASSPPNQTAPAGPPSPTPASEGPPPIFASLQEIWDGKQFADTAWAGDPNTAGKRTTVKPATPQVLVGLESGNAGRNMSVGPIKRCLFLTSDGHVRQSNISTIGGEFSEIDRAKEGYAMGALRVATDGERVHGYQVIYSRLTSDGLDLQDSYAGDWRGGGDIANAQRLGGDGRPVVGLRLQFDNDDARKILAIALIQAGEGKTSAEPRAVATTKGAEEAAPAEENGPSEPAQPEESAKPAEPANAVVVINEEQVQPMPSGPRTLADLMPGNQAPIQRTPVPNEAARTEKRKLCTEIYGKDIAAAKTPTEKIQLAKTIYNEAKQSGDDPAAEFVMLNQSLELISGTGQFVPAFNVIEHIESRFDAQLIAEREAALVKGATLARKPADFRMLTDYWRKTVDAAAAAGDYEQASRVGTKGMAMARRAGDDDVAKSLEDRLREIRESAKLEAAAIGAKKILAESPDDAAACKVWGWHLCIDKGEWPAGLVLVAKGDDAPLAELAKLEVAKPVESGEQAKLADAWWDYAEAITAPGLKRKVRDHAVEWYQLALPSLGGLSRARVAKRLDDFKNESLKVEVVKGWVDALARVNLERDVAYGQWKRDNGTVVLTEVDSSQDMTGGRCLLPVVLDGSFDLSLRITGAQIVKVMIPVGASYGFLGIDVSAASNSILIVDGSSVRMSTSYTSSRSKYDSSDNFDTTQVHEVTIRTVVEGTAARVEVAVDGKPYYQWSGEASRLSYTPRPPMPSIDVIGIHFNREPGRIVSARLRAAPDAMRAYER